MGGQTISHLKGQRKEAIIKREAVLEGCLLQMGIPIERKQPLITQLEGSQGISLSSGTLLSASATYWPKPTRSQRARTMQVSFLWHRAQWRRTGVDLENLEIF